MLGPLIGGTLAQPASKYPSVFDAPLWKNKPYLLPCLVVAMLMVADLVTAYFLLEESRESVEKPWRRSISPVDSRDVEKIAAAEGLAPTAEENDDDDDEESPSLRELLLNARSPFKRVCASYVLFGACYMAYQECFPLFCRAPLRLGGLGLSTTAVGLLQAGAGLATLSGVVVAFPFMVSRFGAVWKSSRRWRGAPKI